MAGTMEQPYDKTTSESQGGLIAGVGTMDTKRYDYFNNLISGLLTFMEVIDNIIIPNEKAISHIEKAKEIASELMTIPREKQIEALVESLPGIRFERIGQHKIVTYKGRGFQIKNNGKPKRMEEIFQPRSYDEIQNYLLSNEAYNKKMREARQ